MIISVLLSYSLTDAILFVLALNLAIKIVQKCLYDIYFPALFLFANNFASVSLCTNGQVILEDIWGEK